MKFILVPLLFQLASVASLSQPRFRFKTRSLKSIETIRGAKLALPSKRDYKGNDHNKSGKIIPKVPAAARIFSMYIEKRDYDEQYWYHPQIHTLGNIGVFGAFHAAVAPLSTHLIDNMAYDGIDVRLEVRCESYLRQFLP